ncbi:PE-PPE domain-containing protein [Williamsia sterculiae]|uniref:PE-PPE domain-containing protein n=1 Tax=Williamsia sterculiae TaxID=1344003 RepID=A0A1N7GJZ0_9NOCA|nr:PE-PPE domain-containing protein [Williamsia sterculiae]SIS12914.1 PE-PPE domain-containing protein [Williamsia sterculiae]
MTATVTVFAVGGTGESFPGDDRTAVTGLLAAVTDALDVRFRCVWVGYPSSYGPVPHRDGVSYAMSVALGERALSEAISAATTPVMVIGYSQGCVVVRNVLARLGRTTSTGQPVLGVGFVADPHQPPGVIAGCDGWGVAGPGTPLGEGLDALWIADPADLICNAGPDSVLRDVADLTSLLSLRDLRAWVRQTITVLRRNTLQNAARTSVRPAQWRRDVVRLRSAVVEILGYLPALIMWHGLVWRNRRGGRHTSYAVEPSPLRPRSAGDVSGCVLLAQWMQVQATFSLSAHGGADPVRTARGA